MQVSMANSKAGANGIKKVAKSTDMSMNKYLQKERVFLKEGFGVTTDISKNSLASRE